MKNLNFKLLLTALSLLFLTIACKSSDDDDDFVFSCINVAKGKLVADVEGNPFSSTSAFAFVVKTITEFEALVILGIEQTAAPKGANAIAKAIVLSHTDIDNTGDFDLEASVFDTIGGVGLYIDRLEIDLDSLDNADYLIDIIIKDESFETMFSTNNSNTGTISICKLTNDDVAGTFDFDAIEVGALEAKKVDSVISITNGEFFVDSEDVEIDVE